jgi:uncharacterized membrane protein YidH (DUF202 family)
MRILWQWCLRVGIIFAVTGIVVLVHFGAVGGGRLSPGAELAIGLVLVIVGVPLVVAGMWSRRRASAVHSSKSSQDGPDRH